MKSIYVSFHLCSDLVFVILFPQLLGAVHISFVNTYGSVAAYIVGLFFRITGGEELIGLPALIKYPLYADNHQNFPFRTLAMLLSLGTLLGVSYLTNYLFDNGYVSEDMDYFKVIERQQKYRLKREKKQSNVLLNENYKSKEKEANGNMKIVSATA